MATLLLVPFFQLTINNVQWDLSSSLQWIFVVVALCLIVAPSLHKPVDHRLDAVTVFLVLYAVWLLLTSTFSEYTQQSLKRVLLLVVPTGILYLGLSKWSKLERIFIGFSSGIILISAFNSGLALLFAIKVYSDTARDSLALFDFGFLTISQMGAGRTFELASGDELYILRFSGLIPNANGLGLLSVLSLSLLPFWPVNWRAYKRLLVLLLLTGVVISFSRMAFVMAIGILIYHGVVRFRRQRLLHWVLPFILISPLILVVAFQSNLMPQSVFSQHHEFLQFRERADTWFMTLDTIMERPWIGTGYGLASDLLFSDQENRAIHSVFLNALVETGIIGTILLICFCLKAITSPESRDKKISAIIFGFLIAEVFDLSLGRFHYLHMIFIVLVAANLLTFPKRNQNYSSEG
ncbi:O-antigen ligase family protein [Thalassospira sp.]|uniref:O-antigen ligase family protein n=1 Tax=Thalassospira sp. TaxID=1912094 RepID=UPI0032F05CA6